MASCPILSCSAPAGVTLQLLACLACEQLLAACNRESPARSSRESLFFLHTLEYFFTLSHSLPLQESHLNTGLLIAEIQAILARNKANKMVDKIQPYTQRGLRTKHFCHHCRLQWHTKPNWHKLRALKNASDQRSRGPRNDKRNWAIKQSRGWDGDSRVMDVMKMIDAFTTCLASFNRRFESHNSHTQSYKDITPNACDVWVKRGTHA